MPRFSYSGVYPDLILIIVFSLIFIGREDEAVFWALIGGVILDLFSPLRFGIFTFSMLILFLGVRYLVKHIFSDPSLIIALLFFFSGSILLNYPFAVLTSQYLLLLFQGLYTLIIGGIIFGFIKYYLTQKDKITI
ncbi:hypothetical protein A3F08_02620 [Candidatus Berkelbacteria bacterium RIFCSPHIGHO2_12_FULL_36_9]|uniref:Rod shape-determining protein MreD n=1 Tax=Candidatus Berkelbacteria bacterium RIFCSPHIGHO2_12_FULL_36_9 TaxID=1797469 RepID=A0A1F5EJI0_9BACT|nr:MAG: hypothetical protein A3F08_02620 [Candidatus Berkelbacteria bacterium RIFCSPHIGHO2_12_FULL_36_9]